MSVISPRLTRRESDEIQWPLGVTGTADVCRLVAGLVALLCLVSGLSHGSVGRPGEDFEENCPCFVGVSPWERGAQHPGSAGCVFWSRRKPVTVC